MTKQSATPPIMIVGNKYARSWTRLPFPVSRKNFAFAPPPAVPPDNSWYDIIVAKVTVPLVEIPSGSDTINVYYCITTLNYHYMQGLAMTTKHTVGMSHTSKASASGSTRRSVCLRQISVAILLPAVTGVTCLVKV